MNSYTNLIYSTIERYKEYVNQGQPVTQKMIDDVRSKIEKFNKISENNKFTDEDMEEFEKGINYLKNHLKEDVNSARNTLSAVSPVSKSYKKEIIDKIKSKPRTAIAIASLAVIVTIGGCSLKNANADLNPMVNAAIEEISNNVDNTNLVTEEISDEPVAEQATEMSESIKTFSDNTVSSIDNALEVGINLSLSDQLTEADKETYARIFTQYRIVANMDDITTLEYAELFGELGNPKEDLIMGYDHGNEVIWKHLFTVTPDNMLDYSKLYNNEKDAEVLNESEKLIAIMNGASNDTTRLEAAKAWYSYVTNILTLPEGNMMISPQALNTLINHCQAYDDLTRSRYYGIQGVYIDDELEHKLNVAKTSCLGITDSSNINVEDAHISNLKSEFKTFILNKLENKYQDAQTERGLQLSLGNTLNPYNSFNEVVKYVEEHIDLTKYVALEVDYIEKQYEEKGINAPAQKSQDDSGVKDNQGRSISKSDMEVHGVNPSDPNAKKKYEEAVVNETNKISEESKHVEDANGNDLNTTVVNEQEEASRGYADGNSGASPNNMNNSNAYMNGYNQGKADREQLLNSLNNNGTTSSEFVESTENITETTESPEVESGYTGSPIENTPQPDNPPIIEEFEPVVEEQTITTEEIQEQPVQTSSVNIEETLRQLYALRNQFINDNEILVASVEEETKRI